MKSKRKPSKAHNMASIAGQLDVPVSVLRQAKRAGASGFAANGNVDPLKLLAWCLTKGRRFKPEMSYEQSRAALVQAQLRKMERDEKRKDSDLISLGECEAWIAQHYLVPMANVFAGMAAAIDTRCNPADPTMARKAIDDYIEGTVKPALRSHVEQAIKTFKPTKAV